MDSAGPTARCGVLAGIGLDLAYGLYTVFALLGVRFVWKALPETKDRALA